ncbi:MAG: SMI1/KNR4 family protein [Bacteroidia bacterium]|nr:SMI1/KNR4 family protein [Bacteroidia bacterium]
MENIPKLEKIYPPVSIQLIDKMEKKLGISLPQIYREFLLQYNGGIPFYNTYDVISDQTKIILYKIVITQFLGISQGSPDDIETVYNAVKSRIPPKVLPIAYDQFKNIICVATDEIDLGKIYFCALIPKIPGLSDIMGMQQKILVASNFEHFVEKLYRQRFL